MGPFTRMLLLAALLLVPRALFAQTAVDLTGHWEGTIQAPGMDVGVEIDVTKNDKGDFAGTFGQPGQHLKGLPLTNFAVASRSVILE